MGIKAAVHGVDPEAVKEAGHCNVGAVAAFLSTFIAILSCGNNLPVSVVIKA